jgi:hypothetical protein
VSLKDIIKQRQFVGKGKNEIFVIVNPLNHTTGLTDAADIHVPENGGTCIAVHN